MRRLTFTFPPGVFEGQDDAKKEEGSDEELQTYDKEEVQKTKMLLDITFYDESIEYNSSGETRIGAAQQLSMVGEKSDYEEAEFQQKGEQERVEASEMASKIGIADSVEPDSTTDQDRGTQELVRSRICEISTQSLPSMLLSPYNLQARAVGPGSSSRKRISNTGACPPRMMVSRNHLLWLRAARRRMSEIRWLSPMKMLSPHHLLWLKPSKHS
jgi:hypothetical protein